MTSPGRAQGSATGVLRAGLLEDGGHADHDSHRVRESHCRSLCVGAKVSVILEQPLLARLQPQPPAATAAAGGPPAEAAAAGAGAAPQYTPEDTLHAFLDHRERQAAAGGAAAAEPESAASCGAFTLAQQRRCKWRGAAPYRVTTLTPAITVCRTRAHSTCWQLCGASQCCRVQ